MKVEFIYDQDCPNVTATRAQLSKAFAKANLPAKWLEWDRNDAKSPGYARNYGSPTILVNGKDVVGAEPSDQNCCRIYFDDGAKPQKVPSVAKILAAFNV